MDKSISENTLYGWPPKSRANQSNLSFEERASILEQKERLEKEELINQFKESVSSMTGKFQYRKLDEADLNCSQIKTITDACINLTISMIKSYFPKTDDLTDEEYEEFIQALANVYYEEKIIEYLNGGNSNEYREIE